MQHNSFISCLSLPVATKDELSTSSVSSMHQVASSYMLQSEKCSSPKRGLLRPKYCQGLVKHSLYILLHSRKLALKSPQRKSTDAREKESHLLRCTIIMHGEDISPVDAAP